MTTDQLSSDQLLFLKKHNIDLNDVFNAKGLAKKDYQFEMSRTGQYIAFNTTPCKEAGHTLRTKSGHCCQCKTSTIAYQKRNQSAGICYVAGSLTGELIKIGYSKAVEVRSKSLNSNRYAGFKHWEILFAVRSNEAGKIENKSNLLLLKYLNSLQYNHDGYFHDSHETFKCPYSKAKETLIRVCEENNFDYTIEVHSTTAKYEFKSLVKRK